MELIGTKILTLRKNKNITQAQLAEALAVSAQSVSKWENNLSLPDISLLPMIARFFGITMDDLFNYRLDALNYKERFIRFMADNGVLQFGEFRLQSGRFSPYFIDTGKYKSASQITKLGGFYAECMREHNIDSNLLAGNTYQEIPIMIAASMTLFNRYGIDIPYCIGDTVGKQMDGRDRVTLIKDTLTSGQTLHANLMEIQKSVGKCVSDVIVSVDRMEKSTISHGSARYEIEKMHDVKIHSIVTLDDIIYAVENGVIGGAEYLSAMKQYKEEYGGE
ncbi:helix-turn-helix domain-containing protein [bacterium D16-51]|nr:helix-turn-helix domain-containing protein [bacterium D16-59]RKI62371.1 helix-turn-helix domain-containing protein [bacterium D16-51]